MTILPLGMIEINVQVGWVFKIMAGLLTISKVALSSVH